MSYRKKAQIPLLLLVILTCVLSLPQSVSSSMQKRAVEIFNPLFSFFAWMRPAAKDVDLEKERLLLENQLLHNEIARLKGTLLQEVFIDQEVMEAKESGISLNETAARLQRRREELEKLLQYELFAVPATILFRPLASWSCSFWINLGERDNVLLERNAISKNSPVVIGKNVVGVVDEVGERLSRVRLLTDRQLCPSVRAVRDIGGETRYLAKGELQGSVGLHFRKAENVLRGIGFNYDYPDAEGNVRNLFDGNLAGTSHEEGAFLVKTGDRLVTTGMDGVFPPGLTAAIVKRVHPLVEGDYTLSLDADPAVLDFDGLTHVFVLPSLNP